MSITVSYPYDPTGTNVACLIKGERWSLSSINNAYRCIIPELAPFFAKDLKVVHITTGKTLRVGVDFYLGHRYKEIEAVASDPIYGSISFLDPSLFGEVELEYRTLGGDYVTVQRDVANYLVNLLVDPVQVHWDDVLNKPEFYPPEDHEQSWYDFVNTQGIADAINDVTNSIETYSQKFDTEGFEYIMNRIQQLETIVLNSGFDKHIINISNPHSVSYDQADALGATESAVRSLKAYGKTLIELAAYINAREITEADLDHYLRKTDDQVITQSLVLKDGVAKIRNSGIESIIDLSNGSVKITCKGTAHLLANTDRTVSDESAYLQAGNNILRVRSQGPGLLRDGLTYNNAVVIHLGNLREYLGTVNFGVVHVTTVDTATGNWTGVGTSADPLKVTDVIPIASSSTLGGVMLTAGTNSTSTTTAATAASLAAVVTALKGYVLKSVTINGQALASNITFDKTWYGLDQVNNTSDLNKPISTAQQDALDLLANIGHKHDASGIEFNDASSDTFGVTYLMTSPTQTGRLLAVTPAVLQTLLDRANAVLDQADYLLDKDLVDLIYCNYSGTVSLPAVTQTYSLDANGDVILDANGDPVMVDVQPDNWWALTLPTSTLYHDQVLDTILATEIDFTTIVATPANRTYYVYAEYVPSTNACQYLVSLTKLVATDNQLLLGTIKTGATTFSTVSLASAVSFGDYRELELHKADTSAHGYGTLDKSKVGLGLVENYPLSHYANPFSPKSIIGQWTKVQETLTSHLDMWTVSGDQSYLDIPLVGLSSAPVCGKYLNYDIWNKLQFDSGSTFKASYKLFHRIEAIPTTLTPGEGFGAIEVILGVYKSGTTDYRLSVVYKAHATQTKKIVSEVWYNYQKAGAILLGTFMPNFASGEALDTGILTSSSYQYRGFNQIDYLEEAGIRKIRVTLTSDVDFDQANQLLGKTVTEFTYSDLPDFPNKEAIFNSGAIGFMVRAKATLSVNFQQATVVQSKKEYLSADALNELYKRGHGIKITQGTIGGNQYGYLLPLGCSRGFVMSTPRSLTTTSSGLGSIDMTDIISTSGNIDSFSDVTATHSVKDTAGAAPSAQTYDYIVIGFLDDIDLIETV